MPAARRPDIVTQLPSPPVQFRRTDPGSMNSPSSSSQRYVTHHLGYCTRGIGSVLPETRQYNFQPPSYTDPERHMHNVTDRQTDDSIMTALSCTIG